MARHVPRSDVKARMLAPIRILFVFFRNLASGISPRRRLYPPACKPYGLESEPEASITSLQAIGYLRYQSLEGLRAQSEFEWRFGSQLSFANYDAEITKNFSFRVLFINATDHIADR